MELSSPGIEAERQVVSKIRTDQSERFSGSYIPTLDGWRAIAVSLVIGAHSYAMLMNNGSDLARHVAGLFNHAGIGVDIFFCLSGYLICTILITEKRRTGTISMSRFYTRRAFRILPPMLLFATTLVVLWQEGILPDLNSSEFRAVLLFYRNYTDGSWYTAHFWSLAVEEQFYVVAPLFLVLLNEMWAPICGAALIVLCIAIRYFEFSLPAFSDTLLQFRTENRYDGLLWGMMLAFALSRLKTREWVKRHLTGFVCLAIVIVAGLLLFKFESTPFRRTVVAALMPAMIGYTILHATGWLGRVLELAFVRWMGRLSYSLYIWQMLFLPQGDRPLGLLQAFPWNLVSAAACAVASYYVLERPMIRLGHRLASPPESSVHPTPHKRLACHRDFIN